LHCFVSLEVNDDQQATLPRSTSNGIMSLAGSCTPLCKHSDITDGLASADLDIAIAGDQDAELLYRLHYICMLCHPLKTKLDEIITDNLEDPKTQEIINEVRRIWPEQRSVPALRQLLSGKGSPHLAHRVY
jgi:hypothetical protein